MEQPIPAPHRPLVMGTQQAVSTGHYLATLAAMRVLDQGGTLWMQALQPDCVWVCCILTWSASPG